jgi:hypothetical protein
MDINASRTMQYMNRVPEAAPSSINIRDHRSLDISVHDADAVQPAKTCQHLA